MLEPMAVVEERHEGNSDGNGDGNAMRFGDDTALLLGDGNGVQATVTGIDANVQDVPKSVVVSHSAVCPDVTNVVSSGAIAERNGGFDGGTSPETVPSPAADLAPSVLSVPRGHSSGVQSKSVVSAPADLEDVPTSEVPSEDEDAVANLAPAPVLVPAVVKVEGFAVGTRLLVARDTVITEGVEPSTRLVTKTKVGDILRTLEDSVSTGTLVRQKVQVESEGIRQWREGYVSLARSDGYRICVPAPPSAWGSKKW